ncbi:DNA primase [Candidatus Gottesmanbacteria bacterium]|nr:DNA primase [Candidatus Gottesmanbacteria bacterium]
MTDVELVKSKIDIVEFLSDYIQLKKAGRNFKALCPFHSEKSPSFVVSPERQTWHCFGACAEGGDVVKFLEKWENIDFLEALKILAGKTGVTLSRYTPTDEGRRKEKLYEINHLASEFFSYILTSHNLGNKAREYLKDRKIKDETIKTFSLGYSPNSWDSLHKFLLKKRYTSDEIYTAGLIIKTDGGRYYDRFRGRLMFALKDPRGNVLGFSGRKLPPQNDREAKYVNTSDTPIYSKGNNLYGLDVTRDSIKKVKEAIVVEGEFDLLASFQSGVTNVVAIKGSALTEGQVLTLKRYTETLLLALDSDFAGNEAARRGIEVAENAGLTVKIVQLPQGKDPAECISEAPHAWKKAVSTAFPIYDFIIETAIKKYGKDDVSAKKKVGDEIIPFLSKITNPIVLSHYVKFVARELGVTEESIEIAIDLHVKKRPQKHVVFDEKKVGNRSGLLEEHILSLILQSANPKEAFLHALEIVDTGDFSIPPVAQIMKLLNAYFQSHETLDVKVFEKTLTPEISETFDRAYLVGLDVLLKNPQLYHDELTKSLYECKKNALRRRVADLTTKIRLSEEEGKENEKLQEELRDLLVGLSQVDKALR